jgi:hypothetical protein
VSQAAEHCSLLNSLAAVLCKDAIHHDHAMALGWPTHVADVGCGRLRRARWIRVALTVTPP